MKKDGETQGLIMNAYYQHCGIKKVEIRGFYYAQCSVGEYLPYKSKLFTQSLAISQRRKIPRSTLSSPRSFAPLVIWRRRDLRAHSSSEGRCYGTLGRQTRAQGVKLCNGGNGKRAQGMLASWVNELNW